MSADSLDPTNSIEDLHEIDRICQQFESSWQSGQEPSIEQYVDSVDESLRADLLRELLLLELDYRSRKGEQLSEDEYRARFPRDSRLVSDLFEALSTGATKDGTRPYSSAPMSGEQTFPSQFGDYALLEVLGEGGMGTVYRARQSNPDRTVALKVIRPDRLDVVSPERRQGLLDRFQAEAQAAAQLEHKNIVPVYEVGQFSERTYFSMRYIGGQTLHDRLEDGPLEGHEAAELLKPVVNAVHYAHVQGVLHRDLKPHNVLLDSGDNPYVTDFGLARSLETPSGLTQTGDILGTPSYMSPEQARGERDLNASSDIYGLGATLYEMLTGRPPFRAASFAETLRQVINVPPVPPRRLNPAIDRDLETICLKCLEKESTKRYATAEQLAEELDRYQQGRPIQARPITRPARVWRWCKRNRTLAFVGATAAVLLLMLAIGGPLTAVNRSVLLKDKTNLLDEKSRLLEERTGLLSEKSGLLEERTQLLEEKTGLLGEKTEALKVAEFERGEAETARDEADADRKKTRRTLYLADMKRAEYYWGLSNIGVVRALLRQYLPKAGEEDLRSFEWYYWWKQCHQNLMTLEHESEVQYVAFSPHGELLASASVGNQVTPGRITLWNASTGKKVHEFQVPYTEFRGLAFSAAGDTLTVAGGFRPQIKSWDVSEAVSDAVPKPRPPLTPIKTSPIFRWTVALAPDLQSYVYSVGGLDRGVVKLRDLSESESKPEEFDGRLDGGAILGPKGRGPMFAVRPGGPASIYSSFDEDAPPPREYGGPVYCMAFSPDGKTIAAGGRQGTVKLWDAVTRKLLLEQPLEGHTGIVWAVAFSPDGSTLASAGSDGTIAMWEVASGKRTARLEEHSRLEGHNREVRSLAFFRDGTTLVSTGADSTIKLWDLASGQLKLTLKGHAGPINCLACTADSRTLASAGTDGTVKLWSTTEKSNRLGRNKRPPAVRVRDLSGERQEKPPASSTQTQISQLLRQRLQRQQKAPAASTPSPVYFVAFSSDGRTLAVATRNDPKFSASGSTNRVELWDWRKREKVGWAGADQSLLSIKPTMALSPNGRLLYTGWFLQDLTSPKVFPGNRTGWSLGGEEVRVGPFGAVLVKSKGRGQAPLLMNPEVSGDFSPDGQILATAGLDGSVKLWEPTTGKPLGKFSSGAACCQCVAFSGDGISLAVAAERDVQLWNVDGRKLQHTFRGHSDYVRCVAFSRDGKTLVSSSSDGTVKLWDIDACSVRATLRGHYGGVSSVAISSDDKTIASAGRDGTIKLWDLRSGEETTTLTGHTAWVTSVAFSRDGRTLVSTGEDGTVRLWEGATDEDLDALPANSVSGPGQP